MLMLQQLGPLEAVSPALSFLEEIMLSEIILIIL